MVRYTRLNLGVVLSLVLISCGRDRASSTPQLEMVGLTHCDGAPLEGQRIATRRSMAPRLGFQVRAVNDRAVGPFAIYASLQFDTVGFGSGVCPEWCEFAMEVEQMFEGKLTSEADRAPISLDLL